MVWSNWSYTKRKQKEMTQKSVAYQEKPSNDTYQYNTYNSKPPVNSSSWKQENARQRRVKIISTVMITLMSIIYTSIIVYFILTT
jgi:hypothetical protein